MCAKPCHLLSPSVYSPWEPVLVRDGDDSQIGMSQAGHTLKLLTHIPILLLQLSILQALVQAGAIFFSY